MTTGEKIKYFRNMRGISQETLGQIRSFPRLNVKNHVTYCHLPDDIRTGSRGQSPDRRISHS